MSNYVYFPLTFHFHSTGQQVSNWPTLWQQPKAFSHLQQLPNGLVLNSREVKEMAKVKLADSDRDER